ncbi:Type 1 glutamine amidotransferase-like domain-containing protein [Paucisalibacillus sp. EB02]|uniref:Type 1 glutamine amidotransferase-like domain-containing protein n=1 Tax=Paucisalibacillus sp. EB02 TaxID=1347087 RepID=UPI0004B20B1A|nr:Type 1 glutamine amidotransferase-like domain-containing protein [Paucisalibacillus sp. EB02]
MDKHLFLFGGGSPFTKAFAKKFAELSTGGPIAILFLNGGEPIIPRYTNLLEEFHHHEFTNIPLPLTLVEKAINLINQSKGIIICGGDSIGYAENIVDTPISEAIRGAYENAVPIAGFSAGALISPEVCVISARDSGLEKYYKRDGVGLLSDTLIAVHFTQWDEQDHLRQITSDFPTTYNYGIDENTGLYFKDDNLQEIEGGGVYSIKEGSLIQIH